MCTASKQATLQYFMMVMNMYKYKENTKLLHDPYGPTGQVYAPPPKKITQLMTEMSDEGEPSDSEFYFPGQPSDAELLLTEPASSKSEGRK